MLPLSSPCWWRQHGTPKRWSYHITIWWNNPEDRIVKTLQDLKKKSFCEYCDIICYGLFEEIRVFTPVIPSNVSEKKKIHVSLCCSGKTQWSVFNIFILLITNMAVSFTIASTKRSFRSLRLRDMRMYPKVFGLAAWNENCKWYCSLALRAVVALFYESFYWVLPP